MGVKELEAEIERLRAANDAMRKSIERCQSIHGIDSACEIANEQSTVKDCRWEIGISRIDGGGIDWQNVFVHAAAQIDAEAEATRLGYYRNVRLRPV